MTKSWVLKVIVIVGVACAIGATVNGQVARTSADSSQDALVTELRALRAEIGQIARTSIRTQLLVARLQLQEQRILNVDRQRLDIQNLLATLRRELVEEQTRLAQLEEVASETVDEAERRAIHQMLPQFKAQMGQKQRREQDLQAQENELVSAVNDEQSRWAGFNERLDELERSLAVP